MKLSAKQLAQTALLLAICIASQFFKNLSVYITGPVVNAAIIIGVLAVGLWSGLFISIIAPVTAFLITGSPIMAAIPLMFPAVMGGNIVLALCTWYFQNRTRLPCRLAVGLLLGSALKAAFMGIVIVLILLPSFGGNIAAKLPKPEALPGVLAAARITFSITQLITALTGSLLAYLIWRPLRKFLQGND
ncbi:MAG: ECF transporter S component [Clostridium sp.]|nr:ECF transporter S component [Clostridium sp.]